jgi:hypothetical protein
MESRPNFPIRALLAWLAVVADLGGTAGLFIADVPLALKVAVDTLEAIGFYTILVYYLGRKREWDRARPVSAAPRVTKPRH